MSFDNMNIAGNIAEANFENAASLEHYRHIKSLHGARRYRSDKREHQFFNYILIFLLVFLTLTTAVFNICEFGTRVTETYVVKPGDTLYGIACANLSKNTAKTKYILEFQHEIVEANPQINGRVLQPGDEIIIPYYVR